MGVLEQSLVSERGFKGEGGDVDGVGDAFVTFQPKLFLEAYWKKLEDLLEQQEKKLTQEQNCCTTQEQEQQAGDGKVCW